MLTTTEKHKQLLAAVQSGKSIKKLLKEYKPIQRRNRRPGLNALRIEGVVVAKRCLYHNRWEPIMLVGKDLQHHEYRRELRHSADGYDQYCREGYTLWGRRYRYWENEVSIKFILDWVSQGKSIQEIQTLLAIEKPKYTTEIELSDIYNSKPSFEDREECWKYLLKFYKKGLPKNMMVG